MKRMGNHGGSIGSQHQIQAGLAQNPIMGSGQNLMSDPYQQGKTIFFEIVMYSIVFYWFNLYSIYKFNFLLFPVKGILKKPPYCPIDKDRWDDRLSSSSQNNLVNLTSGHGLMDPVSGGPGPRSDSRQRWKRDFRKSKVNQKQRDGKPMTIFNHIRIGINCT